MTEEEMETYRRPRSKEEQERVDEYIRIRDKLKKSYKNLFKRKHTQEDMENFSRFLAEQNQKRPDFTEVENLIKDWRTKMGKS